MSTQRFCHQKEEVIFVKISKTSSNFANENVPQGVFVGKKLVKNNEDFCNTTKLEYKGVFFGGGSGSYNPRMIIPWIYLPHPGCQVCEGLGWDSRTYAFGDGV